MRSARALGGAAASKLRSIEGKRAKLDTPLALARFTGQLIQDVLAGTTPTGVARTVLYGISIQRQLVESGELEKRLTVLEQQLKTRSSVRRSS